MVDTNAKIGQNNKNWERIMGKHMIGKMNENRGRLTQFCEINDRVIGGSLFPSEKYLQNNLGVMHPTAEPNRLRHDK